MELAGVELAGGRLQVAAIAARQGIPERYLEQMMTSLRRGGIVRSSRGPRGGYQLARPAAAINLAEVIKCMEGDPGDSLTQQPSPEQRVVTALADELSEHRLARLEATTLASLLEQRDALLQAQTMYFI